MSVLTLEQLNDYNPEKIYDLPLTLNINLWNSLNLPITLPAPIKLEFNEALRSSMPTNLKKKKGIYFFVVEPNFPFVPTVNHLVYIGRVVKTNTFFKRFYEYIKAIGNQNVKRNRQLMTNAWPTKTYIYYFVLENDNHIEIVEKELIDKIIPPLNNKFSIKEATNTRSIYN